MASSIVLSDNGVSSGSAGIRSSGGNDGTLLLQTTTSGGTATTAVTIDTSQNATFANKATFSTTIGVGGATPANTGSGVSFPATQSASSDANTLDDYEKGTWTPGAGNLTVSGSFSSSGTYTKVGRLVTVQATLTGSTSITGPAGNFFTGLPFTPSSISAGSLIVVNRGAGCQVEAYINGNVYVSGFSATGTVYVTISYEV